MKRDAELLVNPVKLLELDHPYAEILAQGNREYATAPEEAEHFYRTRAHLCPRPRRATWAFVPVVAAAAALIALVAGVLTHFSPVSNDVTKNDALPGAATALPHASPIGESTGVKLDAGERKLSDGSVVNLSKGGSARLRDRGKRTSIALDRGKVTLAVEPRAPGSELEVSAGAYRFKVIGTRFSVTRADDAVALSVNEGRVAVFSATEQLAIVSAGGDWSSAEATPEAPTPEEPPAKAPVVSPQEAEATPARVHPKPGPDCRELARGGESRKAEACYLERSSGTGLDAETALLEVARLRRDVLDDPAGALAALESYRTRFANGSLRREADIAHVVLLARLGRQSEALAESQELLDSPNGRERAFELRLLRGNIYRKSLGNAALAAQEFAQAERLEGGNSEATYLLGSTLEDLGDARGAAAAYRRYLEKSPRGKRAGEVRERLARLSP